MEDEASWYLVSTDDRMIPPEAQRAMSKRAGSTVGEVKGSHAVYVSAAGRRGDHREGSDRSGVSDGVERIRLN